MKLGAVVLCANEWRFMTAVVGQLAKVADQILIVRNRRSFAGTLVELLPAPVLASTFIGDWPSDHATRNAGLDMLSDCDYVLTVDSDEIFLDADLKRLRELCERNKYKAIGSRLTTYWKTPEWRIDPPEHLVACVAVKKGTHFHDVRRVQDGDMVLGARLNCHHLSYVRTDEEMQAKLRNFAHADEVKPGWFENVWAKWKPELENLHPTHPAHYKKAVHDPNAEINAILTKYGVR